MIGAALSYAHGTSSAALIGETIGRHFDRTITRWSDRPGLIACQRGVRWTWRELGEKVDDFAAGLIALGLKPGERIGIWSPNNAEWVVTQFATAKAGLILVNINPAYRLAELEYALNKVGCRALITATSFKTSDYVGMINTLAPELRRAAAVAHGQPVQAVISRAGLRGRWFRGLGLSRFSDCCRRRIRGDGGICEASGAGSRTRRSARTQRDS